MNPYALAGATNEAPTFGATPRRWEGLAAPALRAAVTFWFGAAVLGQLLFAFYVAVFYGRAAAQGRLEHRQVRRVLREAGERQVPGQPMVAFTHVYGAPGISSCAVLTR